MKKRVLISIFATFCLMLSNQAFCEDEQMMDETSVSEEVQKEEVEKQDPAEQAAILYNDAIDLYKQDEINKSIEYFKRALELKPDFYEAHYNLAQILMSINKNDEAIKSLEAILKLKPNDSENFYNLGKAYYKQGFLSKSYEYLKKISVSEAQYDSAKLLITKIEKRQDELNLSQKISSHEKTLDTQGKQKGIILADFSAPSGISLDSRGNIFIASFLENQIYKISTFGQKTPLAKSSLIQGPIGLALDKDDNIYVANYSANNIIKITPENNVSIFADINKPYCITYDAKHNRLYVTEQDTNNLVKFDL